MKTLLLTLLLISCCCTINFAQIMERGMLAGFSDQYKSENTLGEYTFGYNEDHTTGGSFRRETGDRFGNKIGSYGLRVGDGRVRIVNYVADNNGFRTDIDSNEPGLESQNSNEFSRVTKKNIHTVLVPGFKYSSGRGYSYEHTALKVEGDGKAYSPHREDAGDMYSDHDVGAVNKYSTHDKDTANMYSTHDEDAGNMYSYHDVDTANMYSTQDEDTANTYSTQDEDAGNMYSNQDVDTANMYSTQDEEAGNMYSQHDVDDNMYSPHDAEVGHMYSSQKNVPFSGSDYQTNVSVDDELFKNLAADGYTEASENVAQNAAVDVQKGSGSIQSYKHMPSSEVATAGNTNLPVYLENKEVRNEEDLQTYSTTVSIEKLVDTVLLQDRKGTLSGTENVHTESTTQKNSTLI